MSEEFEAFLQQGKNQLEAGQYSEALKTFSYLIKLHPNNPEAYHYRGIARYQQGNLEDAIANFTQVIELDQNNARTYYNRGLLRYCQGNLDGAITDCSKTLEIDPEDTKACYNRGFFFHHQGNLDSAINDYTQAIKLDPNNASAYYNRGLARAKQENLEAAIADYNKALEINPDYALAYYNLNPNFALAFNNRGNVRYNQGDLDGAIADYSQTINLNSNDAEAYVNRGSAHYEQGKLDNAIADHTQAIKLDPKLAEAHHERGRARYEQENLEGAITDYNEAIKLNPKFAEAYHNRGVAYREQGKFCDAITDYNEAIKLNPKFAEAYGNRGRAQADLLQYEAAIGDFDCVISLNPTDYLAWKNRTIAVHKSQGLFYSVSTTLPEQMQNRDLDKRGYEGSIATLTEGLKYVPKDSEGWGKLHHELGYRHYAQGRTFFWGGNRHYFNLAKQAFDTALKVLTENDYPEAHLEVLSDYIRLFYALEQSEEAENLEVKAANFLEEQLLNSSERSPFQKRQLALKFYHLRQLAVQTLIRQQNLTQALTQAEKDKNRCLQWLLKREWIDPKQIKSPSFDELQKQLPANSAVIYWYLSPIAFNTFIITSDDDPQLLETADLNSGQFNNLQQLLQQCREPEQKWHEKVQDHLETLNSLLNIPELVKQLPDDLEQLILVPHRDLHRLPLHALFWDYFPSSVTVRYLPSLQTQVTLQQPKLTQPRNHDLLTLQGNSDKLQWVDRERSEISSYFQAPSYLSQEAKPNWDTFTETLQQSQGILHYCGHAKHNYKQPSQSQLKFNLYYDDHNEPEPLTAEQICQLDLTAYDLTVLSGCETGITGTEEIETEYLGLGSAFLSSGVNCVVSTLWPIEDVIAWIVVKEFYRQLVEEKQQPAAAWKLAVEWLRGMKVEELQGIKQQLKEEANNFSEELRRQDQKRRKARKRGDEELKTKVEMESEQLRNQLDSLKKMIQQIDEFNDNQNPFANPIHWASLICQGGGAN